MANENSMGSFCSIFHNRRKEDKFVATTMGIYLCLRVKKGMSIGVLKVGTVDMRASLVTSNLQTIGKVM